MQRIFAHLAATKLNIRSHPPFAELEPQHCAVAAAVPKRLPDEGRQPALDLLFQMASVEAFDWFVRGQSPKSSL